MLLREDALGFPGQKPTVDSTCAVVVTYHPDAGFPTRIERMVASADRLVIVDNASNADAKALLRRLAADPRIVLIENSTNEGVAAALNMGIAHAVQSGYEWTLLFDQDTEPFADIVDILATARASYPNPTTVALVGAMPVDASGTPQLRPGRGPYRPVSFVITSGSLLSLRAFNQVGPFRADYFIDSVDREYGLRLRAAGHRVLLATAPAMVHVWGDPTRVRFGPVTLPCSNHSPLRRYYITRNWLHVLAKYLFREPGTIAAELCYFAMDTTKAVVLEPQGWRKVVAVLLGTLDAVRWRMGRSHPRRLEGR